MSTQGPTPDAEGRPPTEEELQAFQEQMEEEMRRVTVDQVLLQSVVSLINLTGRRLGLAPGAEGDKDLDQVRLGIDAVRALLPLIEDKVGPQDVASIRNALSQLQMAYAQEAGGAPPQGGAGGAGDAPKPGEQPPKPEGGGSAQSSGRLWVPGQ